MTVTLSGSATHGEAEYGAYGTSQSSDMGSPGKGVRRSALEGARTRSWGERVACFVQRLLERPGRVCRPRLAVPAPGSPASGPRPGPCCGLRSTPASKQQRLRCGGPWLVGRVQGGSCGPP